MEFGNLLKPTEVTNKPYKTKAQRVLDSTDCFNKGYQLIPWYRIFIWSHCKDINWSHSTGYPLDPIAQYINWSHSTEYASDPIVQDINWSHCTEYLSDPTVRISIDPTIQDPILPFVTPYSHTLEMSLHVKLTQTPQVKRGGGGRIRILTRDFESPIKTDQHVLK